MAEVGAQTGPQQGGNQARDPLINVRDRLFHTLFFKLSVAYARGCPRPIRRIIETFILLKAIICFASLVYIHIAYARNPVQCLEDIKGSWPRDGILRVEIMKNPPDQYTVEQSYEKERTMQLFAQRQNDEIFSSVFGIFTDNAGNIEDQYYEEQNTENEVEIETIEEVVVEEVGMSSDNESSILPIPDNSPMPNVEILASDSLNGTSQILEEAIEEDMSKKTDDEDLEQEQDQQQNWHEDPYIVEYSLEYGFLRLSPATRKKLNISVQIVVLDPTQDSCFGDSFSKFILQNFLGYDDVLMSSIKSLAEHEDNKGFLRYYKFLFTYTNNYSPLLGGSNFGFPASNRFFPGQ